MKAAQVTCFCVKKSAVSIQGRCSTMLLTFSRSNS